MPSIEISQYSITVRYKASDSWVAEIGCFTFQEGSHHAVETARIRFFPDDLELPANGPDLGVAGSIAVLNLPVGQLNTVLSLVRTEHQVLVVQDRDPWTGAPIEGWAVMTGRNEVGGTVSGD
ncbi:hypothetical protein [Agromyces mariniharenae]|uniref:Uncharacterized protein n=1 Tax=Agromyces mariniharenae TaxID=2604423 RepID=A0A5S4UX68_9MICO|nr:hypothetical protein [Agromyces mariniharenae]TYL51166.1 hypothetical protein FYC51_18795 [Agromyces mariniharenae]